MGFIYLCIKRRNGRDEKTNLELEYSKNFPAAEKTICAISASHSVESSCAFLKSPLLLFEKVTCLAAVLSIFLIWIFCRDIGKFSTKPFTEKINTTPYQTKEPFYSLYVEREKEKTNKEKNQTLHRSNWYFKENSIEGEREKGNLEREKKCGCDEIREKINKRRPYMKGEKHISKLSKESKTNPKERKRKPKIWLDEKPRLKEPGGSWRKKKNPSNIPKTLGWSALQFSQMELA